MSSNTLEIQLHEAPRINIKSKLASLEEDANKKAAAQERRQKKKREERDARFSQLAQAARDLKEKQIELDGKESLLRSEIVDVQIPIQAEEDFSSFSPFNSIPATDHSGKQSASAVPGKRSTSVNRYNAIVEAAIAAVKSVCRPTSFAAPAAPLSEFADLSLTARVRGRSRSNPRPPQPLQLLKRVSVTSKSGEEWIKGDPVEGKTLKTLQTTRSEICDDLEEVLGENGVVYSYNLDSPRGTIFFEDEDADRNSIVSKDRDGLLEVYRKEYEVKNK